MKVLFTCLGNICRSPMAEGILKSKLAVAGMEWEVASNGTNRYHKGGPADDRTIRVCRINGIDISKHIARRFQTEDFKRYDLIVCMAQDVLDELQQFVSHPDQLKKVVVQEFDDPWYGQESDFENCYLKIASYCEELIRVNS